MNFSHLYEQTVDYRGVETPAIDLTAREITELGLLAVADAPTRALLQETAVAQQAAAAEYADDDSRLAYHSARAYVAELTHRYLTPIDVTPPIVRPAQQSVSVGF